MLRMLFQFSSLQIVLSVISSCIIERTHLDTYLMLGVFISSIVFPIPLSWIWGNGWLQRIGALDFAGSGIISLFSGVIGLIGTLITGPRLGVFDSKLNVD